MRGRAVAAALAVGTAIAVSTAGCDSSTARHPVAPTSAASSAPASSTSTSTTAAPALLRAASGAAPADRGLVLRSRAVEVRTDTLLEPDGTPREGAIDLTLNLFPDTEYATTVRRERSAGGVVTWTGTLSGVKLSTVTVLRTSGVFIVKIASPEGVFEISRISGSRYRLDELDPAGPSDD